MIPVIGPSLPPTATPPPTVATPPPAPRDTLGPSREPDVRPADVLRALRSIPRVDKAGHRFGLVADATAPDGTVYLGYKEWSAPPQSDRARQGALSTEETGTAGFLPAGYVAAVRPGLGIAWEAKLDDLRALSVDDAGRLHAVTGTERVRMRGDGLEEVREAVGGSPASAWVDPRDGRLFMLDKDRHLVLPSGGSFPDALRQAAVQDFAPAADGRSVELRAGDRWYALNGDGVVAECAVPANETHGRVFFGVDRVIPMADGALCVMRHTVEIAAPYPQSPFGPGSRSTGTTIRRSSCAASTRRAGRSGRRRCWATARAPSWPATAPSTPAATATRRGSTGSARTGPCASWRRCRGQCTRS